MKTLLADLIEPRLYVLDGGKALHKAVTDVFGKIAVIQRCQVHKKRNVLAHLPESEQTRISFALTMAYREFEYAKVKSALELLLKDLSHRYPRAADSLRESLEETLTVHRLSCRGFCGKRCPRATRWSRPIPGAWGSSVACATSRTVR